MLDEFGAEIEHADTRLDATMKKMAKVLHLSDGRTTHSKVKYCKLNSRPKTMDGNRGSLQCCVGGVVSYVPDVATAPILCSEYILFIFEYLNCHNYYQ